LYEFLFEFNEQLCFASWFDVVRFSFSYGVLDLRNSLLRCSSFCAPLSAAVALPSHVFPLRSSVLSMLLWFSSLGSQQFKLVLGLAPCVDPLRSWLSDFEQGSIGFSRRSYFLALGFESAHRSGSPASFVSWPPFPCVFSDLISAAEQGCPPASSLLRFQLQCIRSDRHQLPPIALWSRSKIQPAPLVFSLYLYFCSLLKVPSGLGLSCCASSLASQGSIFHGSSMLDSYLVCSSAGTGGHFSLLPSLAIFLGA
jgi:hypothetical protein